MYSPRQVRLNALRGFFHTEFVEEISAKYWENPGGGGALNLGFGGVTIEEF